MGPMVVLDTSSKEQLKYKNAYIITQPDEVRAAESADFTWVFAYESFEKTVAADNNLVGS